MRVRKVSVDSFERMSKAMGRKAKAVKLPSTNGKHCYLGLIMSNEAWVAWPTDFNEEQEKMYIDIYGNPPDLFTPAENVFLNMPDFMKDPDENKNEPIA